jgi:hypothetical protein
MSESLERCTATRKAAIDRHAAVQPRFGDVGRRATMTLKIAEGRRELGIAGRRSLVKQPAPTATLATIGGTGYASFPQQDPVIPSNTDTHPKGDVPAHRAAKGF